MSEWDDFTRSPAYASGRLAFEQAARIDGAGAWTMFRRSTIPLMSPILLDYYGNFVRLMFLLPTVLRDRATAEAYRKFVLAPGASPTNMSDALGLPWPNTMFVRPRESLQRGHPGRNFWRDGRSGIEPGIKAGTPRGASRNRSVTPRSRPVTPAAKDRFAPSGNVREICDM